LEQDEGAPFYFSYERIAALAKWNPTAPSAPCVPLTRMIRDIGPREFVGPEMLSVEAVFPREHLARALTFFTERRRCWNYARALSPPPAAS